MEYAVHNSVELSPSDATRSWTRQEIVHTVWSFITVFTRGGHVSISWAKWIQFTFYFLGAYFMLPCHLCPGFSGGFNTNPEILIRAKQPDWNVTVLYLCPDSKNWYRYHTLQCWAYIYAAYCPAIRCWKRGRGAWKGYGPRMKTLYITRCTNRGLVNRNLPLYKQPMCMVPLQSCTLIVRFQWRCLFRI
jgi:hypothetical protein